MDIFTLCEKIELQEFIKNQVLSFMDAYDFQTVDILQKDYFIYVNMADALEKTRFVLEEDTDGIKILSCMLKMALETYEMYQKKGISDDV